MSRKISAIIAGSVITMDPEKRILQDHIVRISDGKIASIEPAKDFKPGAEDGEWIDAKNKFLFPGLINTHTHIFQTLIRGIGQDLPVWDWFRRALDPVVANLTVEDSYISARLGAIEALRSGTTTILEYNYANPVNGIAEEVVRAFVDTGIRGIVARGLIDMGDAHTAIIHDIDNEISAARNLIEDFHGSSEGLIQIWVAPYTVFSTSEQGFRLARELADAYQTWITVHAGTDTSIDGAKELYGMTDMEFEESIGFLGPDVLAVHCCAKLSDDYLALMKRNSVKVSHNPASNAYLGEGIAPITRMLSMGIDVGLATDGPASNNNQDMIGVLKLAALLQKVAQWDPNAMTAYQVLEMATIQGARCIGLEDRIGSIEIGKDADLIVVDPWLPNSVAFHEPVGNLVYSCTQENVESVLVRGNLVMENRTVLTADEAQVMDQAQKAALSLMARIG